MPARYSRTSTVGQSLECEAMRTELCVLIISPIIVLMGLKWIIIGVATVVAALLVIIWSKRNLSSAPRQQRVVSVEKVGPRWAYPDPARTPGFTNPDVTQENIADTICNPAWSTRNIRPPVSYTSRLKQEQIKDWMLPGMAADYEEDHFISLELGGSPRDPRNLWPEPYSPKPGAKEKDVVENYLHRQVCSGAMTLHESQRTIVKDWYKLYLEAHQ
jgi:hypothetical protein